MTAVLDAPSRASDDLPPGGGDGGVDDQPAADTRRLRERFWVLLLRLVVFCLPVIASVLVANVAHGEGWVSFLCGLGLYSLVLLLSRSRWLRRERGRRASLPNSHPRLRLARGILLLVLGLAGLAGSAWGMTAPARADGAACGSAVAPRHLVAPPGPAGQVNATAYLVTSGDCVSSLAGRRALALFLSETAGMLLFIALRRPRRSDGARLLIHPVVELAVVTTLIVVLGGISVLFTRQGVEAADRYDAQLVPFQAAIEPQQDDLVRASENLQRPLTPADLRSFAAGCRDGLDDTRELQARLPADLALLPAQDRPAFQVVEQSLFSQLHGIYQDCLSARDAGTTAAARRVEVEEFGVDNALYRVDVLNMR